MRDRTLVWVEPINRSYLHLIPGDIKRAITWFENETRQKPKRIFLNPRNERFAEEVSSDIGIIYAGGVLCWEIWLSANGDSDNAPAIKTDGFSCQACLEEKDKADISPDPRYCQGCYDFLLREAEADTSKRGAKWQPKSAQVVGDRRTILSTVKPSNFEVDKIQPIAPAKRGRKAKQLPVERIGELSRQGMGSKLIASTLKKELGIEISYRTIDRELTGQRKHP